MQRRAEQVVGSRALEGLRGQRQVDVVAVGTFLSYFFTENARPNRRPGQVVGAFRH